MVTMSDDLHALRSRANAGLVFQRAADTRHALLAAARNGLCRRVRKAILSGFESAAGVR
jgi:hypothetical protein